MKHRKVKRLNNNIYTWNESDGRAVKIVYCMLLKPITIQLNRPQLTHWPTGTSEICWADWLIRLQADMHRCTIVDPDAIPNFWGSAAPSSIGARPKRVTGTHCGTWAHCRLSKHWGSRARTMKKAHRETQTLHAGCSKVEPKIFAPPQSTFPEARDGLNLISWSLVRIDARNFELWW